MCNYCLQLSLALLACGRLVDAQPSTVQQIAISNHPRPLSVLADQLQVKLGMAIHYEDPAYRYGPDLVDSTTGIARPEFRIANPSLNIFCVRSTSLKTSYDLTKMKASPEQNLSELVAQYNKSDPPALFRVIAVQDALDVITDRVKDSSGAFVNATSPLDVVLSIPRSTASTLEAFNTVLSLINNHNPSKVELGTIPLNFIAQTQITLEAKREPARDVVVRLCSQLQWKDQTVAAAVPPRKLAYRLFYDANDQSYALNLLIVMIERPAPYGNIPELVPAR